MEDSGVSVYRDLNRANWDERALAPGPDDRLLGFVDDPAFLSEVGRPTGSRSVA
ncbi:MAG: hypothetical protein H7270_17360 [Dermatophilaceae bacterium]|nr:hypothetical protein [Dermatophilaceae bacterium]